MIHFIYFITLATIAILMKPVECDIAPAANASQPLNQTMVSLILDHRLLGFVAMMDEPLHHLQIQPALPRVLETKFKLLDNTSIYGPNLLSSGKLIGYNVSRSSLVSHKDKYDKLYFIAHGFQEAVDQYNNLAYALLMYTGHECEKPAVIMVDWKKGARASSIMKPSPEKDGAIYGSAVANSIVVGREVALLTYFLTLLKVVSRDQVHYIGSGLGAQVMHIAGQWYAHLEDAKSFEPRGTKKVGRITGLDPSARDFQGYGTGAKLPYLTEQDADFVDIIHTSAVQNGGNDADVDNHRLGMSVLAGHADFYPNGGQEQPFCKGIPRCSYQRALHYFVASLTNDKEIYKMLLSQATDSHEDYLASNARPTPRPSLVKRFFKKNVKNEQPTIYSQRYMGIEAVHDRVLQNDNQLHGYYLDFALNFEMIPVEIEASSAVKLQLIDTLQPNILSREAYDFSKFPSHTSSKIMPLHPDEIPGCGRFLVPPSGEGRVHFGLDAYVKQFPWNVCIAVVRKFPNRMTAVLQGCTGSLIRDDFVLTAAHCFRIEHPVSATTDIALIRLVKPIPAHVLPLSGQFTNTTIFNTACWRTATTFDYTNTCQELYFSGYGFNDDVLKIESTSLKWTIMRQLRPYKNQHPAVVEVANAERQGQRNTCPGDSGGPLTQVLKTTGGPEQTFAQVSPYTAIIVGTNIGGPPPCSRAGKPSYFCKVGHRRVYSWLDTTLANNTGPMLGNLQASPVDRDIETFLQRIGTN
ncbi:Pancreatic lipase-related protein 2 [Halotydeus destructor]|nr:Pancreatic lipase-related protein 2 [Halotydeus destructor]